MALAAANFLGAIVAACATLFTGSHRLAIHDGAAGLRFPSYCLTHPGPHGVVDLLPCAVAPPRPEVVINGSPRRQIMRQQFPGTPTADDIENCIQNFTPSMLDGTAAWFGRGYQRFQLVP